MFSFYLQFSTSTLALHLALPGSSARACNQYSTWEPYKMCNRVSSNDYSPSHSQFRRKNYLYLHLHGLVLETSIYHWQDQPGSREWSSILLPAERVLPQATKRVTTAQPTVSFYYTQSSPREISCCRQKSRVRIFLKEETGRGKKGTRARRQNVPGGCEPHFLFQYSETTRYT